MTFDWWDDAVEYARLLAIFYGVRQRVYAFGDRWAVSAQAPVVEPCS